MVPFTGVLSSVSAPENADALDAKAPATGVLSSVSAPVNLPPANRPPLIGPDATLEVRAYGVIYGLLAVIVNVPVTFWPLVIVPVN